jgi:hypothetical protein
MRPHPAIHNTQAGWERNVTLVARRSRGYLTCSPGEEPSMVIVALSTQPSTQATAMRRAPGALRPASAENSHRRLVVARTSRQSCRAGSRVPLFPGWPTKSHRSRAIQNARLVPPRGSLRERTTQVSVGGIGHRAVPVCPSGGPPLALTLYQTPPNGDGGGPTRKCKPSFHHANMYGASPFHLHQGTRRPPSPARP